MKSVVSFLVRDKDIFSLSEPGAVKLLNPAALSYNVLSSTAVTISSSTLKPTLYDGVVPYWSKIRVSVFTSIKAPRAKNTPLTIVNADPAPVALLVRQVAKEDPSSIVVTPYVKVDIVIRSSPSRNVSLVLSSELPSYLMYKVVHESIDSDCDNTFTTFAVTPDVLPLIRSLSRF